MSPYNRDELMRLIDASCDESFDDADRTRLEEILRRDTAAVDAFVRYKDMHAALRWLTADEEDAESLAEGANRVGNILRPAETYRVMQKVRRLSLLVLAASLLLAAVSFWAGIRWSARDGGSPLPVSVAASQGDAAKSKTDLVEQDGVARITGLVDCQWQNGQRTYQFGDWVSGGDRVELTDGLVQVTFDNGAKVIIQGPASFTPQSEMEAELAHGKIAAVVSEAARGYTVITPTAEIVDLGTEFALDVATDGSTELHVMEGEVVARRRSGGELHGDVIHARKLDAVRFKTKIDDVERIAAQPDKFARQITPKLSTNELPPLPVVENLKFWVAADLLVSRAADGAVSAWRDVCIGDNQVSNDACQFYDDQQPLWVADAGYGFPAIRFNGTSTRLTTDAFSTGDNVSVFVVCTPSTVGQNDSYWDGQFLNFGGEAPTIELSITHEQGFYSGLWAADAVGTKITAGKVNDHFVAKGKTHVLAYVYSYEKDRAEQWVNGHSSGTESAPLGMKTTSTRTLGGHGNEDNVYSFFRGDLHEVLIYDEALGEAKRTAVTDYLKQRYSVD